MSTSKINSTIYNGVDMDITAMKSRGFELLDLTPFSQRLKDWFCENKWVKIYILPENKTLKKLMFDPPRFLENTSFACIFSKHGAILLWEKDFKKAGYTTEEIEFAIWHEIAHSVFDTNDEELCDDFAFEQIVYAYDNNNVDVNAIKYGAICKLYVDEYRRCGVYFIPEEYQHRTDIVCRYIKSYV